MGLFGGKKNEKDAGSDRMDRASRSRRIVQPGVKTGKTGRQEKPATKGGGAGVDDFDVDIMAKPAAKPKTGSAPQQVKSKVVQRPSNRQEQPRQPAPAPQAPPQRKPAPPPVMDLVIDEPTPQDRPGRKPISEAAPSEIKFSGSLASGMGTGGPSRAGDAALIDFLITKVNLINQDQAEEARRRAADEGLAIDVALVRLGHMSETDMVDALTQECWIPHLRIDKYPIRKKSLNTISKEDAVRFSVLPVDKLGSILNLAMVNPLDDEAIQIIEQKTGLDIKKVVASRSEIDAGIAKYYGGAEEVAVDDSPRTFSQDLESSDVDVMKEKVQKAVAAPEPIVEVVEVSEIDEDLVADIDDLLGGDDIMPEPVKAAPAMDLVVEPPPRAVPTPAMDLVTEPEPAFAMDLVTDQEPVTADDLVSTDDLFEDLPAARQPASAGPHGGAPGSTIFDDDSKEMVAVGMEPADDDALDEPLANFDLDDTAAEPLVAKSDVIDASDLFEDVDDVAEAIPTATTAHDDSALEAAEIAKPTFQELPSSALEVTNVQALASTAEPVQALPPSTPPVVKTAVEKPAAPKPSPIPARPTTTPVRPTTAPVRPMTASVSPGTGGVRRPHTTSRPATKAFKAAEILGKNDGVVTLVPVSEEHFQHAITHGRANAFEKWISIQTRNRIINATPVEEPVEELLAGLLINGYRIEV